MINMVTAKEIYDFIDSFAPFETAMSFDNVGLLIGNSEQCAEKVMLALDITSEIIAEAEEKGIPLIITHHPIIFSPLRNVHSDSLQYKLITSGITVISAHTNLDICIGGVNDTLASTIGLRLDEHTDDDCIVTGDLENELSAEEFAEMISDSLSCSGLRYTEKNGRIKKVTVACGAGGSGIYEAAKAGTDAFVTGEIKHHEILFAREKNISVFDLGHFRSEDLIIDKLALILSGKFPGTEFLKAKNDKEGIKYFVSEK